VCISNKGVTLIEVMIALVVLLLVFLGLMQSALLSIDANLRNILRDEAIAIAEQKMSELKNAPFDSLVAGTTCQTISRDIRNFTGEYDVCEIIANLDTGENTKSVQVVVGWDRRKENPPMFPTDREFQHSITTVLRR